MNTGTDGTAPACTAWCRVHPVGHREWDQHPAAVTKLCRRVIEAAADLDGTPVTIDVQRFASLDEWDVRTVGPVTVQLTHDAPLTGDAVMLLAETLHRVAELLGEPAVVAA